MSNLEIVNVNGQWVTSSRQVAENFGKRHDNVLRDINAILDNLASTVGSLTTEEATPMFYKSEYTDEHNKSVYPEYVMNRDGFTLLAMGFKGTSALEWKLKYIKAFNAMEAQVPKPMTTNEMMLHQLQGLIALEGRVDQHGTLLMEQDKDIKQLQQLILTPITKHPQTQVNWYDLVSEGFNKLLNSGEYYLEGLGGHIGIGNLDSRRLGYVRVGPVGDKIYVQGSVLWSELSSLGVVLPSTNAVLVQCDLVIPSIKGITHVIKFNGESLRVLQLNIAI